MPHSPLKFLTLLTGLYIAFASPSAQACTVTANNTVNLGTHVSINSVTSFPKSSGFSGISCTSVLNLLSQSYMSLMVNTSDFLLKHETLVNENIPFILSWDADGPAIPAGNRIDSQSSILLGLLHQTGGQVFLHYKATPTAAVKAGTYKASVKLTWYYSVCALGALGVCLPQNSPGLSRGGILGLGPVENWGTGREVTINISLTIERGCVTTAPTLQFGSAPLPSAFSRVSQTVNVRCTAEEAYSVGLDNGGHASGNVRRMANGANYLSYDIWQDDNDTHRWGSAGTERRESATADINPGNYNGTANQGFRYHARIRPEQSAPPAGDYLDILRLDVAF